MNQQPLVSVILPFFNSQKHLLASVKSVLEQSYSPFELIVVNDGSTDESEAIIQSLDDNRIFYIEKTNSGAASSRNEGVKVAKGEYISFIDADDLWDKKKLERQYEFIQKGANSTHMIFAQVKEIFDEELQVSQAVKNEAKTFIGYSPITLFISKNDFLRIGYFNEKWKVAEFIDWYDRAKTKGLSELVIPEILAYRRIHKGNIDRLVRKDVKQYAAVLKAALDRKRSSEN